ncbi:MAG TPA: hypothetical protein VJZ03_01180 [Candidatus Bathyarchaeia archaeon]|nr:hypothetical protein [Candidatus Bathyarchaeia archaeon]
MKLFLSESMGRLLVLVPDDLEHKFRFAIVAMKGGKKGGLSAAVIEAIEDWLKKHEKTIVRSTRTSVDF